MSVERYGAGLLRLDIQAFLAFQLAFCAMPAAAQDLSSCNGEAMKVFVGKPVAEMQRVRTEAVRYVCEGCAMTMDYSAERLTVIYSKKTGRIVKMSCN